MAACRQLPGRGDRLGSGGGLGRPRELGNNLGGEAFDRVGHGRGGQASPIDQGLDPIWSNPLDEAAQLVHDVLAGADQEVSVWGKTSVEGDTVDQESTSVRPFRAKEIAVVRIGP